MVFKKGDKIRLGRHHTEETKLKMSIAKKGKKLTEEHKQNINKSHLGKHLWKNREHPRGMLGKHHTEESIIK